jgi:hypothetical protein
LKIAVAMSIDIQERPCTEKAQHFHSKRIGTCTKSAALPPALVAAKGQAVAPDLQSTPATWPRLNRILMVAPVVCSLLAAGIVLGNVAAGARPQADENAWAHLFQLLIAG